MDVPKPAGINPLTGLPYEYLPYQLESIEYAIPRRDVLFADSPGLGKSIETIGTVNADSLAHRILVVCKQTLKINWRNEFAAWSVKSLTAAVISCNKMETKTRTRQGQKYKERIEHPFPTADVIILNYDLLESWRQDIRSIFWDALIVDETHYLINKKAHRTQEIFGCTKWKDREAIEPIRARKRLFLTGTPLVNKPLDLWPVIQAFDPNGLGSDWRQFTKRYCNGHVEIIYTKPRVSVGGVTIKGKAFKKVWDATGASNGEELQQIMRQRFMVRHLQEDVLADLPPLRRRPVILEALGILGTWVKKEHEQPTYEAYVKAMEEGDFETPAFGDISRVRQETGIAKMPAVVQYVIDTLDEVSKIVIFAHHEAALDILQKGLSEFGVVRVDGRVTDPEERAASVARFQTDPKCRVFLGSKAAAEGITLTASQRLILAEGFWTAVDVEQIEKRLQRIGARGEYILVEFMCLEGSLDERQAQIVIRKRETSRTFLDPPQAMPVIPKAAFDFLKQRQKIAEALTAK